MYYKITNRTNLNIFEQAGAERYINPRSINLPAGYVIEEFARGFDVPNSMAFDENGDLYIGESGYMSKAPSVIRLRNGRFERIADGFDAPLTGICCWHGDIYVSHLGKITIIRSDGTRQDIIRGLPSYGDHLNSNVTFGADDKLYFGQGSATNSGVVGTDNPWLTDCPCGCDSPGAYILLNGQNFETTNILSGNNESIYTGAFSPYGVSNMPYEVKKGILKAAGSILRANSDGTQLELVAWGFRFPIYVKFDRANRLFVANQGYDIRGSRPVANAPDEFHLVSPGLWYGWPDFAGGEPVASNRFRPEGGVQPELLIMNHPNEPPRPYTIFPANSHIAGFDYNYDSEFGPVGDVYIAEMGSVGRITGRGDTPSSGRGHRISHIDMDAGTITTFAINKSGFSASVTGEGGLSIPVNVIFGPDRAMYVLDMGFNAADNSGHYYPNTGVIWRIIRSD